MQGTSLKGHTKGDKGAAWEKLSPWTCSSRAGREYISAARATRPVACAPAAQARTGVQTFPALPPAHLAERARGLPQAPRRPSTRPEVRHAGRVARGGGSPAWCTDERLGVEGSVHKSHPSPPHRPGLGQGQQGAGNIPQVGPLGLEICP